MTGDQIKQVLIDNKLQMKDIAEKLGTSLSNLSAGLSKADIRTGLLEKIAEAAGLPIAAFYGGSFGPVQTAVGDNNTQVGGDYQASNPDILELLKMKDEQLLLTIRQVSKAQEQMDRILDRFDGPERTRGFRGFYRLNPEESEGLDDRRGDHLSDEGFSFFGAYPQGMPNRDIEK